MNSTLINFKYNVNIFVFIIFLLPLFMFIFIFPNDWAGWFILFLTYFIPWFIKEIRNSKKTLIITYLVITFHHIIAFTESFITTTFGASKDATTFFNNASLLAVFSEDINFKYGSSSFYSNYLALMFKFFGVSKFFACELSVLAFFISLVTVIKISSILNKKEFISIIVLLFGLLPTCLSYVPITLRESYEMMFFSLVAYFALKFIQRKNLFILFLLTLSTICLGSLHKGLVVAVPILLLIVFTFSFDKITLPDGRKLIFNKDIKVLLSIAICFIIFIIYTLLTKAGFSSAASESLVNGEILSYTEEYRGEANSGGASYNASLNTSSPITIMVSAPWMFVSYMFEPFVWHYRNIMDLYAGLESFLRFLLIIGVISQIRKTDGLQQKQIKLLFALVLVVEFVWAAGTVNWGTAIRHHLVAYGVLLTIGITGVNSFIKFLKRIRW